MELYCLCSETKMKPVGSKSHATAGLLFYECPKCGARVKVAQAWEDYTRHMERYQK